MDGVGRALAHAEHAADTAGRADLAHRRTLVLVAALHGDPLALGDELDEALGAGLGAQAAADALEAVDDRHAVDDLDGVFRADAHAGAQAQAAVVAVRGADAVERCIPAVLDADVVALILGDLAAALAADEGHLALDRLGVGAHDGADPLGHRRAAHGAAVDRGLALDDGGGHGVAAGKAAGAAVVAGQDLADRSLALIHLDATVSSTLEYDPSDTTKIVRWNDVRGAGRHYAEKNAERYAGSPTLLADAQNGLPVVDFGDTTTWGLASGDKTAYNNYPNPGKALCFDEKLFVREGFLVLKSSAYSPILGGWEDTSFFPDATYIINVNPSVNHSLSCLKREAEWRVDENEIDIWNYTWATYQNAGTGYHVISFAITNDYATVSSRVNCAPVQDLCGDRAHNAGGKKYGEVVLFDRSLTVAERAAVRQHLIRKWNTADIAAETLRTLGSLALHPDTTVSLGGIGAVGAFAASGVGTVASDFTLSENAGIDAVYRGAGDGTQIAVTGALTLPSAASLVLTVDMPNHPENGAFLDLFTAESISGSPGRNGSSSSSMSPSDGAVGCP